jgi:hypothetical protein
MAFVILVSWGIASVECRILFRGAGKPNRKYSVCLPNLVIFPGFTALYFREPLTLIQRAGFAANWSRRGSGVPGAVLSREETETYSQAAASIHHLGRWGRRSLAQ